MNIAPSTHPTASSLEGERLLGAVDLAARDGTSSVVTLEAGLRSAVRYVLGQGGLDRALLMLESESPPSIAVRPRRERGAVTVTELLEEDHRRLDALAEGVIAGLERREPVDTRALHAFVWGLRRHIRIEEELLFPRFEEATGMRTRGPTVVMRAEHREIDECLATIESHAPVHGTSTTDATLGQLASAFEQLVGLLEQHNAKEEHVLYPTTDRILSERERNELIPTIVLS